MADPTPDAVRAHIGAAIARLQPIAVSTGTLDPREAQMALTVAIHELERAEVALGKIAPPSP